MAAAASASAAFPDELIIRCVRQHPCLYDPRQSDYKDAERKAAVWRHIASSVGLSAIECEHRWRYLRDRFTRERKRKSQQSGASSGKSNGAWPLASHMHFIQDFIKHRSFKLKARRAGRRGGQHSEQQEEREAQRHIKGENEANNETSSGGDETDEPASPNFERHSGGAECYPMVIIDESDQLVDHAGAPATPTGSDLRAAPDRRSVYSGNECAGSGACPTPAGARLAYNEDELFCLSVAQTLRRLPLMRRSLAKVQILQLIHDMEFGQP